MGIFDSFLRKKVLNIETILNTNVKKLADRIGHEFNTKVLECGIAKKGDEKFKTLLPFGFTPPSRTAYMGYLFIPIDDADNIITQDYI